MPKVLLAAGGDGLRQHNTIVEGGLSSNSLATRAPCNLEQSCVATRSSTEATTGHAIGTQHAVYTQNRVRELYGALRAAQPYRIYSLSTTPVCRFLENEEITICTNTP